MLFAPGLWVPLVVIQNVFLLPGLPGLFQQLLQANIERFKGPTAHAVTLYTDVGEGERGVAQRGLVRQAGLCFRLGSGLQGWRCRGWCSL